MVMNSGGRGGGALPRILGGLGYLKYESAPVLKRRKNPFLL